MKFYKLNYEKYKGYEKKGQQKFFEKLFLKSVKCQDRGIKPFIMIFIIKILYLIFLILKYINHSLL